MHSHLFRAKGKGPRMLRDRSKHSREKERSRMASYAGWWGAPETSLFWQIFPFRDAGRRRSHRCAKKSGPPQSVRFGLAASRPKSSSFRRREKREKGNGVYDFYETVHPREGEGIEKEEGRGEGGNVCRPQKRGMSRNEDEGRKKGEEEGLLALLLWTCMGNFMGNPLENEMSEKEKSRPHV